MRVLLVEDSDRLASAVMTGLRAQAHAVLLAETVQAADAALAAQTFDVAVVDIGLPDGSGLAWCRRLRESGYELPILFLSARNGVSDRVAGLEAGGDDYLGKPFSMSELVARLRALGRRGPRWSESVRAFGEIRIDRDRRQVTVAGRRVLLTTREFDVVAVLAWGEGRVLPREEILEKVWGDPSESASGSLEVLMTRIRRKLGEGGAADVVRTVRQVGYAWSVERSKRG